MTVLQIKGNEMTTPKTCVVGGVTYEAVPEIEYAKCVGCTARSDSRLCSDLGTCWSGTIWIVNPTAIYEPCQGMNCGCTDGKSHSLECLAEHAASIAGGVFSKPTATPAPSVGEYGKLANRLRDHGPTEKAGLYLDSATAIEALVAKVAQYTDLFNAEKDAWCALQAEVYKRNGEVVDLMEERDALRLRCEAAERDAARYRPLLKEARKIIRAHARAFSKDWDERATAAIAKELT